jgi:signal transduction histidine kinase/CheY-like chemotaxis protein/streptogramin lyase
VDQLKDVDPVVPPVLKVLGPGRLLIVAKQWIAVYETAARRSTTVLTAAQTGLGAFDDAAVLPNGKILVSGGKGLGLCVAGEGPPRLLCSEFGARRLGLKTFHDPQADGAGGFLVSGASLDSGDERLIDFDGHAWRTVWQGDQAKLHGWPGADGTLWIQKGNDLFRLRQGRLEPVPRQGAMAGRTNWVLPAQGGVLLVGSAHGLARYSPPLWQEPPGLAGANSMATNALVDHQGRLWLCYVDHLVGIADGRIQQYPMPKEATLAETCFGILLDGNLLFVPYNRQRLWLFDPNHGKFRSVVHPSGAAFGAVAQRPDGTAWVQIDGSKSERLRLDIFDGHNFRCAVDIEPKFPVDFLKFIVEDRAGTVWFGGPGGLGRYSNGSLSVVGAAEGYTATGGYALSLLPDGRLMAGGKDKLLEFDGWTWKVVIDKLDRVRAIVPARDGAIWVASATGVYLIRNGVIIPQAAEEGLASDVVNSVFEDRDGKVWAATTSGFSVYHPEADVDPPHTLIPENDNLHQTSPNGNVRLVFTGMDRWKQTPAGRLLYSYRIDSGPWSSFQEENRASFRALRAGSHRFEACAMDRNGNVDPRPPVFQLFVPLPWYLEGGFLFVLAFSILTIAGLMRLAASRYRQLRAAKTAAIAASLSKSAFLANMSHEIRTPMNGIMGMTDLALTTELTVEQRDCLLTVKTSADQLLALLNDILDFSQIEAGKLDISPVEFRLRDCVGDALHTLAARADEKGLDLLCRVAPEVPDELVGDPHRLRQIVLNLVGNAIKFTERGEVAIEIAIESCAGEGVMLHFRVADTGVGIPAEKQTAVFEAFEQADPTTTRKYGGTGLGLAISTRLVQLMGGRIWLESPRTDIPPDVPVVGCAFHFTVAMAARQGPPLAAPAQLDGVPVLIVDDNGADRTILVEMLRAHGANAQAAASGEAALDALMRARRAGQPFAMAILDLQMPGMDGLELAKRIREQAELRDTRLFMLTSAGRLGGAVRRNELGIEICLLKPVKHSALLEAMTRPRVLPAAAGVAHVSAAREEPGRKLRVLLAEDNAVNQKLAVRLLEKHGYQVVVANDGEEAVGAVENGGFDLILMDVQMPKMSGLEAAAAIRNLERGSSRHLPIIAMTANAMKGDKVRYLEAGMDGYISKPIQGDCLLEMIAEFTSSAGEAMDTAQPLA